MKHNCLKSHFLSRFSRIISLSPYDPSLLEDSYLIVHCPCKRHFTIYSILFGGVRQSNRERGERGWGQIKHRRPRYFGLKAPMSIWYSREDLYSKEYHVFYCRHTWLQGKNCPRQWSRDFLPFLPYTSIPPTRHKKLFWNVLSFNVNFLTLGAICRWPCSYIRTSYNTKVQNAHLVSLSRESVMAHILLHSLEQNTYEYINTAFKRNHYCAQSKIVLHLQGWMAPGIYNMTIDQ
jgi:hypothetical protein